MNSYGRVIEDPFYDDDGVLVDEDADWEDVVDMPSDEYIDPAEWDMAFPPLDNYDPFATINS